MNLTKIYYFYDPMCGWCFGFSSVIQQVIQSHPHIPLEVVCGGMVKGSLEGPIGDRGTHILNAIPRVESQSGTRFGEHYKNRVADGTMWNSSVKPSIALSIVKKLYPEHAFAFTQKLQHAYFGLGQNLNDSSVYHDLLKDFHEDSDEFLYWMGEQHWIQKTFDDFEFTANVGITGFPTLVGEVNDKFMLLAYGFCSFKEVNDNILQLQEQETIKK